MAPHDELPRAARHWCRTATAVATTACKSIAMVWLAAATHHSAQQKGVPRNQKIATRAGEVEAHETHVAARGQKPPSPGVVVPSLLLPRLGQGDDAIDAKTLSFLVSRSLAGEEGGEDG